MSIVRWWTERTPLFAGDNSLGVRGELDSCDDAGQGRGDGKTMGPALLSVALGK